MHNSSPASPSMDKKRGVGGGRECHSHPAPLCGAFHATCGSDNDPAGHTSTIDMRRNYQGPLSLPRRCGMDGVWLVRDARWTDVVQTLYNLGVVVHFALLVQGPHQRAFQLFSRHLPDRPPPSASLSLFFPQHAPNGVTLGTPFLDHGPSKRPPVFGDLAPLDRNRRKRPPIQPSPVNSFIATAAADRWTSPSHPPRVTLVANVYTLIRVLAQTVGHWLA